MKIKKIEVSNFRILEKISVDFDDVVTLVVGRNNSGKTSLTEVFNNFFSSAEKSKFRFEDFTLRSHKRFLKAEKRYYRYLSSIENIEDERVILRWEKLYKLSLPKITANIYLEYEDSDDGNLASISNFVMDLDIDRKDVLIACEYGVVEAEKLFKSFVADKSDYSDFLDFLRKNLKFFEKRFFAVDKNNLQYRSYIEKPSEIENVFLPRFIHAQTNLDDKYDDNNKGLSRGFENYYKYNKDHEGAAKELKKSLETTSVAVDKNYKDFF